MATKKQIPYGRHYLDQDDISAVIEILESGVITQGPVVEQFGQAVADYSGARYGVAVSSGTAALHLSVASLGIGQGDEVITTPMSFCATSNAVLYQGADVRFVDIDRNTMNIDVTQIEENITPRTKAIMPVDFRGHPADWPRIKELADKYNLKIIEDGSHSLGSDYFFDGNRYRCGDGRHATLATHSFHPVKHVTTGEGGVISTNDEQLALKLRLLRKHGIDRTDDMFSESERTGSWFYDMSELGFNYRITDFQSALGLSQLKKVEVFKKRRREIVNYYNEQFQDILELIVPFERTDVESNFHLYILQIKSNNRFDRYDLYNYLREAGYLVMVHYVPTHFLTYYRNRYGFKRGSFPESEQLYDRSLSIPLYPTLTDIEVEEVVSIIKKYVKAK